MKKIHVVLIVANSTGGGAQLVVWLAAHLDPRRFTIALISSDSAELAALCDRTGVAYHPLPLLASRTSRQTRVRLQHLLQNLDPDVIHAHGTRAAWYVSRSLARQRYQGKLIYTENLFAFDGRRGPWRLPWYAIERYLCRRADYLTTSCQINARLVIDAGWATPDRIWLQHYGIDLEAIRQQATTPVTRAELGLRPDVPVVGTVGRLIAQKGIRYLIDAATTVLATQPETIFLVVGDGVLRQSLESYSQARGVANSFRFLGAQAQPWRYLAVCDVIALPSLFEGLPLAALEALAAGLPVVTTPVGGCPEVVIPGQTGLLVPPRDGMALAEALLDLLRDPDRRTAMALAAPEIVRKYDVGDTIDAFAALYDECARQQGATRNGAGAAGAIG